MNGQMHGNIKDSFHKFKVCVLICESLFFNTFFFFKLNKGIIFLSNNSLQTTNQICLSERMIKKVAVKFASLSSL